jgi:putative ABC transport system ATP-binding protein
VSGLAAMISVKGLRKSIRNGTGTTARTTDILKGIDFEIPTGQFAAIMGSSGSGKSTLLGLLAGLDTPSAGDVSLNGVAISYLPEDKLAQVRGRTIGFVFQSYQLIPTLTALENVLLPHELNADAKDAAEGLPRARQLLTSVGLGAGWIIIRCSFRVASSSGWRWRGRLFCGRRLCWRMSRRGISTRRTGRMCWSCC